LPAILGLVDLVARHMAREQSPRKSSRGGGGVLKGKAVVVTDAGSVPLARVAWEAKAQAWW
jgi:hypothetical protein